MTTVFANLLTHELGHVLGLRHGVSQDLAPSGLDRDPEEVIGTAGRPATRMARAPWYRMTTGAGWRR